MKNRGKVNKFHGKMQARGASTKMTQVLEVKEKDIKQLL